MRIGAGFPPIVEWGNRLQFGERPGLTPSQETSGTFPSLQRVSSNWHDGNTANVCIGQDPVMVTPLQMAVMSAAIANGGTVYWPRLVENIEAQDQAIAGQTLELPAGRVRDHLGEIGRASGRE